MRFSAILAIPLFFAGALAAPSNAETLLQRGEAAVGQIGATEAADKFCFLGKCINRGGGPKCNVDRKNTLPQFLPQISTRLRNQFTNHPKTTECFASQSSTILVCGQNLLKSSVILELYCALGVLNLGVNMVCFLFPLYPPHRYALPHILPHHPASQKSIS